LEWIAAGEVRPRRAAAEHNGMAIGGRK
jgi:hypothetical protein